MKLPNKDKKNTEVVGWSPDGSYFIIFNTSAFTSVLSRYFKTKNYSSFIRQLNMYDFHKIKDQEGQAFRHEKFRRGGLNELRNIKRKVRELATLAEIGQLSRTDIEAGYSALQKQVAELNTALKTLNSHNQLLLHTNKEHMCSLFHFKIESDLKVKQLMFLFHVFATNYYPKLVDMIESSVTRAKITLEEQSVNGLPLMANFGGAINQLSKHLLYKIGNQNFLDKLLGALTCYLKQPSETTLKILKDEWKTALEQSCIGRLDVDDQNTGSSMPKVQGDPKKPFPLDNFARNLETIDRKEFSQNDEQGSRKGFVLDLRSENFNDMDLLCDVSQFHPASPRSSQNRSGFHKNNLNSFLQPSPQSESKTSFKF